MQNRKEELLGGINALLSGMEMPGPPPDKRETDLLGLFVEQSQGRWRAILEEKTGESHGNWCPHGGVIFAYAVEGDFIEPDLLQLLEKMRIAEGHETGRPPWLVPYENDLAPYPLHGAVECSFASLHPENPGSADFWRVSPKGLVYLWRGYQEDLAENIQAGAIFDLVLPIWRVGETLLHAARFARLLSDGAARVRYTAHWSGLKGRRLAAWADPMRMTYAQERQARQEVAEGEVTADTEQIKPNLADLVMKVTAPVYEAFDFYRPSIDTVREELGKMMSLPR